MKRLWEWIKSGYLRVIEPVADFMVRHRVSPNAITTFGTLCTISVGGDLRHRAHLRSAAGCWA